MQCPKHMRAHTHTHRVVVWKIHGYHAHTDIPNHKPRMDACQDKLSCKPRCSQMCVSAYKVFVFHSEGRVSRPVGLTCAGFHARPFVPHCIPLSWINALLLSHRNEQAESTKRGLRNLERHKSIERQSGEEAGGSGSTHECVCMRAASRQRGAKADTLHLDHLL